MKIHWIFISILPDLILRTFLRWVISDYSITPFEFIAPYKKSIFLRNNFLKIRLNSNILKDKTPQDALINLIEDFWRTTNYYTQSVNLKNLFHGKKLLRKEEILSRIAINDCYGFMQYF